MHIAFDGLALIAVVLVNSIFGLLIYLRNTKDRVNILYTVMVFTVSLWAIANYFTNHVSSHDGQVYANRLSFTAGLLLVLSVWFLSLYFPRKSPNIELQSRIASWLAPVSIAITTFTPWIVQNVTYQTDKQLTSIVTGPVYAFYIFSVLVFFVLIVLNFYKAYKHSNALARYQIIYAALGILLTFAWILFTSAIIPALTGNWEISKFGSLGTVLLIAATGYAIIKHRLFDIRLVVARSAAYLLSLITLGAVFTLVASIFTGLIFKNVDLSDSSQRWLYTILAGALAFVFVPIKQFFDKTTSRIFYRDAYDSQVFLDQFNKLLVATYDLQPLLKSASDIIATNLKPAFCVFGIKETRNTKRRIIGTADHPIFKEDDIDFVRKSTIHLTNKVTMVDELTEEHHGLQDRLRSENISVICRLTGATKEEGIGYLVLGPKKSGNLYSSQDMAVLEIISNELVIAIQNALRFEEIENFNLTLQQKVDEATHKLRRANEKLKSLDETKDDFISMASHQLRTPLTSVKGYLSMVLEEDAGKINSKQKEMLGQAFSSSQRMVYLIADLLNVSRLKTGKFIIEKAPINLANVIEQELAQLDEVAKARSLDLRYDKPKQFPDLMIDDTKTRQVIMNFVDNAIYYTPAGGQIDVKLIEKPSTIELRVEDNGIGVPKTEQHHLFTKFYRAGNARKARPDGTGLGLFMAKKVVVAQGGSIIFESKEGKGSTFGFVFSKNKLAVLGSTSVKSSSLTQSESHKTSK